MCVLIGNTVKTKYADYPCATREEAEALFMRLREREHEQQEAAGRSPRQQESGARETRRS
jgi:hypothetical protein